MKYGENVSIFLTNSISKTGESLIHNFLRYSKIFSSEYWVRMNPLFFIDLRSGKWKIDPFTGTARISKQGFF